MRMVISDGLSACPKKLKNKEKIMTYFWSPFVRNERIVIENGKTILMADTPVILDCCHPLFSLWARDKVEADQARVAMSTSFDAVQLNQI